MSLRNGNWLAGVLSATALALTGCAMGAPVTVQNSSNAATTVNQTVNVDWRLNLSAAVGDAAAAAVADTVKGMMSPAAGAAALLTPEKKQEVVQKAVAAGAAKVKEAGGEVTPEKQKALEDGANSACAEAAKASENAAPANP